MLIRRLCSTLSSRQLSTRTASSLSASSSSPPCKPHISTRGRLKPLRGVSVGTRLSAARLSREDKRKDHTDVHETKGRRKLRHRPIAQHPESAQYSFQPVRLYPAQMAMHLALTPSHMPLPVHLGANFYASPPSTDSLLQTAPDADDPFHKPRPPPCHEGLTSNAVMDDSQPSVLRDHLHILDSLSHPDHMHHLGSINTIISSHSVPEGTPDLAQTLTEAGARHRVANEMRWERMITHLGGKASASTQSAIQPDVDDAVVSLEALLGRLGVSRRGRARMVAIVGPDGQEEWVRMDSTQRKRKKKMSKHKYQKRRKATRALRRKLGK